MKKKTAMHTVVQVKQPIMQPTSYAAKTPAILLSLLYWLAQQKLLSAPVARDSMNASEQDQFVVPLHSMQIVRWRLLEYRNLSVRCFRDCLFFFASNVCNKKATGLLFS